ncbi:ExbD/TolR family protein [Thermus amyloliquefaciens]|uniref:ExbD/TolR family protein n=1 Tax=Thermus amyloliquefaciens TaxID=1449080 RepID=UPI000B0A2323|nr:biopolymer transporter ExbD [Thermus amyloliquefaciens]
MELPRGEGLPGGGAVVVELDRQGRLALNGKPVRDLPALEEGLRALGLAGRPVRLEADAQVAHGRVVAVMEAVRRAGGERIQVAVRR